MNSCDKHWLPIALLLATPSLHAQAPAQTDPPRSTDQVTVTANRTSVPIGGTAKTTYTLDSADLHDFPAQTLDESLRQHAGFELFRRAGSRIANPTSEGISLRGLGSTAVSRTLVLEDGAPLNDPFGGWVHWSESPQPAVQSVTLVTGGGSDLYGSSALGGVIDVIPAAVAPTRFNLSAVGGSQSTSDLTALASHAGRNLGALLAAESLGTDGYIVTDPTIAGRVDTPANVLGQTYRTELGRRDLTSRRLFVTGNLLNEARSNGTPIQTNATRLWRYLVGYDLPEFGSATSRARIFGSDQGYRQSFSTIAADRNSESLSRLQRVRTQEIGASADSTIHLRHLAFVTGADLRDIRASDNETPFAKGVATGLQDVTARQRFLGAFSELLGESHHWSAAASIRADRDSNLDIIQTTATTRTAPANRTEVVLSPRVGLVRSFGTHAELHASGFRAFRSPSMNELYRTGQVGQEITQANAALLSERATGWEVGGLFTSTRRLPATLRATCFWTEINRPVSAVLISGFTSQRQNLGQILSRGIELALDAHPAKAISITVGYQYADATVTKFPASLTLVGNRIPQVPAHAFTAQLRTSSARLGELTIATRTSSQAFDDASNRFPLAGYYSLDLSASHHLNSRVSVFFLAQNLTNQRAQVARTPTLTLGSPIFAEAGLRITLSKPAP